MLQALLGASDGVITLEEFRPFCLSNKVLLMPLFSVQEKLRNAAMGKTFWEDMAARRVQLTASRTVPLADLMVQVSFLICLSCFILLWILCFLLFSFFSLFFMHILCFFILRREIESSSISYCAMGRKLACVK